MIRPWKFFGMGMIILLAGVGFCHQGWAEKKYTVKSGDTLYVISKSFGVSIGALKKANALEGDSLKPKQVLTIPSLGEEKMDEVVRKSSSPPPKKPSPRVVKKASGDMDSYVVQKGDTLSNLSKKVDLSAEEIKKMNNLHTSALRTGQILLLPKDRSRLDEVEEKLGDEEEITEASKAEGEKEEPNASTRLGKWSDSDERNLFVRVVKTFLGVPIS